MATHDELCLAHDKNYVNDYLKFSQSVLADKNAIFNLKNKKIHEIITGRKRKRSDSSSKDEQSDSQISPDENAFENPEKKRKIETESEAMPSGVMQMSPISLETKENETGKEVVGEEDEENDHIPEDPHEVDMDINRFSVSSAQLAAGGLIDLTRRVLKGQIKNAFSITRPPGHHAEKKTTMGFCIFNNVAIAAKCATTLFGCKRVSIFFPVHFFISNKKIHIDLFRTGSNC